MVWVGSVRGPLKTFPTLCSPTLLQQVPAAYPVPFVSSSEMTNKITNSNKDPARHKSSFTQQYGGRTRWGGAGKRESSFFYGSILFGLSSVSWGSNDELEPSLYLVLMQFTGIKWHVNNPCSQHDGWGKPPIFFFVLFLMFCDLSHLLQKPIKKNRSPLSILSLLPSHHPSYPKVSSMPKCF